MRFIAAVHCHRLSSQRLVRMFEAIERSALFAEQELLNSQHSFPSPLSSPRIQIPKAVNVAIGIVKPNLSSLMRESLKQPSLVKSPRTALFDESEPELESIASPARAINRLASTSPIVSGSVSSSPTTASVLLNRSSSRSNTSSPSIETLHSIDSDGSVTTSAGFYSVIQRRGDRVLALYTPPSVPVPLGTNEAGQIVFAKHRPKPVGYQLMSGLRHQSSHNLNDAMANYLDAFERISSVFFCGVWGLLSFSFLFGYPRWNRSANASSFIKLASNCVTIVDSTHINTKIANFNANPSSITARPSGDCR